MFNAFADKWKIKIIETGSFKLDGGAMMGSVPKVLWEKTNPCDKLNRIDLSMRCLLLDNGKDVILIESGIGNKNNEKFMTMFCIEQSSFPLKSELKKHNYELEDITHVILTHLHFDHAGGATYFNGKEKLPIRILSTDNTGNIIKEHFASNPQVKCYFKFNEGFGSAIKKGIELS